MDGIFTYMGVMRFGLDIEWNFLISTMIGVWGGYGLLAAKILQAQEEADLSKLTEERRQQIGWAKRSEKTRTYNFPQNRLTDHRINKSFHNLEDIIENGKWEKVFEADKEKNLL